MQLLRLCPPRKFPGGAPCITQQPAAPSRPCRQRCGPTSGPTSGPCHCAVRGFGRPPCMTPITISHRRQDGREGRHSGSALLFAQLCLAVGMGVLSHCVATFHGAHQVASCCSGMATLRAVDRRLSGAEFCGRSTAPSIKQNAHHRHPTSSATKKS